MLFARPDGERVATMDLPAPTTVVRTKQNYAVIYEHAVYALITALDLSSGTGALRPPPAAAGATFDRLVIEVEGQKWLGLCWTGGEAPCLFSMTLRRRICRHRWTQKRPTCLETNRSAGSGHRRF